MAHAFDGGAALDLAAGDETHKPSPVRLRVVQGRCAAAEQASVCFRDGLAQSGCSLADVADKLGVRTQHVHRWADPNDPAAVTLRDLLAGPPRVAEAVLEQALSRVREREVPLDDVALRRVLVALCVDVGQVLDLAERDGVTKAIVPVLGRLRERAGVVLREAQRRLAAERAAKR